MKTTIPQFMGYRFGIFNYTNEKQGGFVGFGYFYTSDQIFPENK